MSSDQPSLAYLIRDTARVLIREMQTHATAHGATLSQVFVLRELLADDGLTVRELGDRLDVAYPRMTMTIDELERKKLARRRADAADRRRVRVYLTARGRELCALFHRLGGANIERALADIPSDEVAVARSVLLRMRANISASFRTVS